MKIISEEELTLALARIDVIFFAEEGAPEFEELDVLLDRVVEYEAEHYPMTKLVRSTSFNW